VGAALVVGLARVGGPTACLVGGAAVLLITAALAPRLTGARRVVAAPAPSATAGAAAGWSTRVGQLATAPAGALRTVGRAWADGAVAVRRNPLAGNHAVVVALAGAFASSASSAAWSRCCRSWSRSR
jgi:hypothetical protein